MDRVRLAVGLLDGVVVPTLNPPPAVTVYVPPVSMLRLTDPDSTRRAAVVALLTMYGFAVTALAYRAVLVAPGGPPPGDQLAGSEKLAGLDGPTQVYVWPGAGRAARASATVAIAVHSTRRTGHPHQ